MLIIDDTDTVTSRLFRESFNCRYNSRMDYAFCLLCLLTLKSSEKWRSPLFGATGNSNHQILPYGILLWTFINTNVFYLLSFKFSRSLVKTMAFSFKYYFCCSNVSHFLFQLTLRWKLITYKRIKPSRSYGNCWWVW